MLQYATFWQLVVLVTYVLLLFIFTLHRYLKMRHGYEFELHRKSNEVAVIEGNERVAFLFQFVPYFNVLALLYFMASIAHLLVARPSQEALRVMDKVMFMLLHIVADQHMEELRERFQHLGTMVLFHQARFDARRRHLLALYEKAYHGEDEERQQRLKTELLGQLRQLCDLALKFELAWNDCAEAFAQWQQCHFSDAGREKAHSCIKLALQQLAIACSSTAEQST